MIREALSQLVEGRDLDRATATGVMEEILRGEATPSQIAGFAVALRMKGETVDEVAGLARAMRSRATPLSLPPGIAAEDLLDTCGTGGDGAGTFNVSTAVAFVAAGAGARVAKHGNRAVSSRSGSADCLEALGIPVDLDPEEAMDCLARTGVVFLFAPLYHGALRHAAQPRKEMGLRTVFNVLGPISNPAGAGRQLVGVYHADWVPRLAHVLRDLGARAACVVHSTDGLDEISVFAPTRIAWLSEAGTVREEVLDPHALGLFHADRGPIVGGDPEANADQLRRLLAGESGVARDLVLVNAAAALRVAGLAGSWEEGVAQARESIDSGRARERLQAMVSCLSRAPRPASPPAPGVR